MKWILSLLCIALMSGCGDMPSMDDGGCGYTGTGAGAGRGAPIDGGTCGEVD